MSLELIMESKTLSFCEMLVLALSQKRSYCTDFLIAIASQFCKSAVLFSVSAKKKFRNRQPAALLALGHHPLFTFPFSLGIPMHPLQSSSNHDLSGHTPRAPLGLFVPPGNSVRISS